MVPDSSTLSTRAVVELSPPLLRPISASRAGARLQTIDAVRGLAIVLMVLDHTRDFFSNGPLPTDLKHTSVALFLTRWVTHFCAPAFVFLAGTSAYFVAQRMSASQLRRYLLTRGAWLIALEFSVVNFVWQFNFSYSMGLVMQVIWVIGASMCALALLVALPRRVLLGLSLAVVAGHNLLDGVRPEQWGTWAPLWQILHVQGPLPLGFVHYPLLPWMFVMALGFCAGELFELPAARRRKLLFLLGACACALFVVLRALDVYGDPKPWTSQSSLAFTLLSFLNVTKYPPSLAYLLITLGALALLLSWFEGKRAAVLPALATLGQVPLFAYVLHLALVHLLAGLMALALGHGTSVLTHFFLAFPKDWGIGLAGVYCAWLLVLLLLYPACRWFAQYKRANRSWWLSYC